MVFISLFLIVISIALLFTLIVGVFFALDTFLELPYVGAKKASVSAILDLAGIKKGETVIDLGSGDGRLLFEAANLEAFAVGYEINPFLIIISKIKRYLKGYVQEVKILNCSMWKADLKVADVIFVYSLAKKIKKFEDFIYNNAPKGTRIIVNTNPFPTKKPIRSKDKIFLYVV